MVSTAAEPRKRPRQRRSRATVDRIVDAAARIFDQRGYQGTTTNDVAVAAGVSIGSLYQYFPNKDALLVAIAERHVEGALTAFAGELAERRADEPDLATLTRSLLALTVAENATPRLHALLFRECPRTDALTERLDRLTGLVVDEVAWHLERLGAGGGDAGRRAALIVAAADAAVHQVVLAYPPGPDRDAALDDLARLLLDGLTGGRPSGREREVGAPWRRRARG